MNKPDDIWCRHYTGFMGAGGVINTHCSAGVAYQEIAQLIPLRNLPCTKEDSPFHCEKCDRPTAAEVEREDQEIELRITQIVQALKLVREQVGAERGVAGKVPCPVCAGDLHYTVAKSNGHIWGMCNTVGCLSWVQ